MKWIKKNKFTVIAIILFVLFAIIGFKVKEIFFPNQRTAIYGDRLDGKVAVEKSTYDELKQKLSENERIKNVTVTESGRRINIIMTVVDDMSKEESKKLTDNITSFFSENQIGYYDFEVFVKKEATSENDFPIIGYKHHNSSSFSWTKDRDKVEETEE